MTSGVTAIEPATAADAGAIVALLAAAGLPTADLDAAALPGFYLLHDHGRLIGAVGLERYGRDGLLRSLAVAPVARGRGLGRALVAAVEQQARADGMEALLLLTQTAAPFFASLGYQPIDRSAASAALQTSTQFAHLCPASAVCMRKFLSP